MSLATTLKDSVRSKLSPDSLRRLEKAHAELDQQIEELVSDSGFGSACVKAVVLNGQISHLDIESKITKK